MMSGVSSYVVAYHTYTCVCLGYRKHSEMAHSKHLVNCIIDNLVDYIKMKLNIPE